MKKIFTVFAALLFTASMFAQSPEKISYQAVIRNTSNELVSSQTIGIKISILQGSTDRTVVYTETQNPTTNTNGLVTFEIGDGSTTDDFSAIDWANGLYFIKTETDPTGGTNYTITGTSQLLSVPYALHAKTAETVESVTVDYTEIQNTPDLSNIATQQALEDTAINIRSTIPDVGSLATQSALEDSARDIRSAIPDVSNFITSEQDGDATNEIQTLAEVTAINNSVNSQLKNVTDPTDAQDAATKAYVDALLEQIEELQLKTGLAIKDIEGNIYKTVIIGTQTWLAENLRATKLNDGTPLSNITNNTEWSNLTESAYCWYNNDSLTNAYISGAMYNWYTVNTGNLCPTGWHVPSHAEWTALENYLADNGYNYDGTTGGAGAKVAKALAKADMWPISSIEGAVGNTDYSDFINKSGFSAVPGGDRGSGGNFYNNPNYGWWWSSTEYNADKAWARYLYFNVANTASPPSDKFYGISVRCVKD